MVFILINQQCGKLNIIIYVLNQRVDFQSWKVELRRSESNLLVLWKIFMLNC